MPPDLFLLPAALRAPPLPVPAPVPMPVASDPFVIRDFESFPNKLAIGRGDFGTVFRVSQPVREGGGEATVFAVKRVETKRAARDERRAWQRVQSTCGPSSHVIPLLASWNDDGFDYYSMPLCSVSLASLLADEMNGAASPRLSAPAAAAGDRAPQTPPRRSRRAVVDVAHDDRSEKLRRVLGDIARALACLHSQGIVYRDMKPDHILWCNGQWVLADLGHALFLEDKRPAAAEGKGDAQDGDWYSGGAGAYLDPTVFDQGYDTSSDVYALGKMIWSVLLKRPVWTETELDAVVGPLLMAMQSDTRSERPTGRQVYEAVEVLSAAPKHLLSSPMKRTRRS